MKTFFIFSIFAFQACFSASVKVNFAWNKPPVIENVVRWDIYKINPITNRGEWFGWASNEVFSGEFEVGTHRIAVIASNSAGHSPPSDNLTFVVTDIQPITPDFVLNENILTIGKATVLRLGIEFSANLSDWRNKPFAEARFYRIKVESR